MVGFQSSKPICFARTPTRAPYPTHTIIRQINATLLITRIPNTASQILLIASPRMTLSSGDPRYRPVADLRNNVLLYHYCGAGSVTEGCPWPNSTGRSLKRGVWSRLVGSGTARTSISRTTVEAVTSHTPFWVTRISVRWALP